jgi:hypothetical protein
LNGGPVLAAGEIRITKLGDEAKLLITNKSGHYRPCFNCLRLVLSVLENKFGLNLQDITLEDVMSGIKMSVEDFEKLSFGTYTITAYDEPDCNPNSGQKITQKSRKNFLNPSLKQKVLVEDN